MFHGAKIKLALEGWDYDNSVVLNWLVLRI